MHALQSESDSSLCSDIGDGGGGGAETSNAARDDVPQSPTQKCRNDSGLGSQVRALPDGSDSDDDGCLTSPLGNLPDGADSVGDAAGAGIAQLDDSDASGREDCDRDVAVAAPRVQGADPVGDLDVGFRDRFRVRRHYQNIIEPLRERESRLGGMLKHVAQAWNSRRLRVGERIAEDLDQIDSRGAKRVHPNSWTAEGTLRLAFSRLGSTTSKKTRLSSRSLDATGLVSYALVDRQEQDLVKLRMSTALGLDRPAFVWVQRRWDETPINVRFGLLLDMCRPIATYWWRDPEVGREPLMLQMLVCGTSESVFQHLQIK